jgi:hypothetical protein
LNHQYTIDHKEKQKKIIEDFLDLHSDLTYISAIDCQRFIKAETGDAVFLNLVQGVQKMRKTKKDHIKNLG